MCSQILKEFPEALPGGGSRVACLNFKMSRVGVLSVLHVAVRNLMKIVCPCRNLRLRKTVQNAENRSRAEVLYHLRLTHAYLVTSALRVLPDDEPALTPEFRENLLSLLLLHGMPAGHDVSRFRSGIFFFIGVINVHINLCIKLCPPLVRIYCSDCLQ